ncbi:MAG: hypothetical protein AAFR65_09050 [Pseudomonadota bacterium]
MVHLAQGQGYSFDGSLDESGECATAATFTTYLGKPDETFALNGAEVTAHRRRANLRAVSAVSSIGLNVATLGIVDVVGTAGDAIDASSDNKTSCAYGNNDGLVLTDCAVRKVEYTDYFTAKGHFLCRDTDVIQPGQGFRYISSSSSCPEPFKQAVITEQGREVMNRSKEGIGTATDRDFGLIKEGQEPQSFDRDAAFVYTTRWADSMNLQCLAKSQDFQKELLERLNR